jgi:hypothetical protein
MYKQFNDLAETFLSRMEETFPNEPKIKIYRQQFSVVQSMNSRKPVEMFMENMFPFGEKILRKDEMFFKKDEFVNAAESISGKMGLIKYWDTISDQTKNSIWEYIQGLYILGMASLGYQAELQELITRTGFKA